MHFNLIKIQAVGGTHDGSFGGYHVNVNKPKANHHYYLHLALKEQKDPKQGDITRVSL